MVQKSSWKTRGFPKEVGNIGEKTGKIWLENKGYNVYSYQDIFGLLASLKATRVRMSRRRKKEYKEDDRKIIQKLEKKLFELFGQKYEALETVNEAISQLEKTEKEKRLAKEIKKQKNEKRSSQKNDKSRREIFEAVNQLVKCVSYENHQVFERIKNVSQSPTTYELLVFYFPIIVFDGDMFEVTFESGEPKLKRTNHIILKTNYRCPYCKEVESFMIDVVHSTFFNKFLKILRNDSVKLRENMLKKYTELIESDKKIDSKLVVKKRLDFRITTI